MLIQCVTTIGAVMTGEIGRYFIYNAARITTVTTADLLADRLTMRGLPSGI